MRTFYANLFSEDKDVVFSLDNLQFPEIEEEEEFTEDELYNALKHFGSNESPGSDGFSIEFYRVCWHIVNKDFMNMLEEFFEYDSSDMRLNCSFLSLIPKEEDTCS